MSGARVTFAENIYFHIPGEQPIEVGASDPFEIETETPDEEPYSRRYKLNTSPIPIELHWLEEKAGMLHIRNLSTDATIHLSIGNIFIPPKASIRLWADWSHDVLIYASKEAVAYVTILPK